MDFHMRLNDNKAGLEGLDKDRINAIIKETSEGSLYTKYQDKRAQRIQERIRHQREAVSNLTADQIRMSEIEMDRVARQLEDERDLSRTIVHIDMDAFYAAVEMRDNPALRNVPMAVGGMSMLSTSNYIARRFGVRAAMAGYIGKKLCPQLVIVPLNFDKYRAVSDQIRKIFSEYDPNFSAVGLDEAYLDITDYVETRKAKRDDENDEKLHKRHRRRRYGGKCECKLPRCDEVDEASSCSTSSEKCEKCGKERVTVVDEVMFGHSAEEVTRELRFRIEQETGLTASAGIAVNTLLAKVCTDIHKPNGQYFLPPTYESVTEFVKDLPIRKICGIGAVTESMLKALGIETCKDLYDKRALLALVYSKSSAKFFLRVSLGLGSTFLENSSDSDYDRKSIGVERTFAASSEPAILLEICRKLCEKAVEHMKSEDLKARTVILKIKTAEFDTKTRATTLDTYVCDVEPIYRIAKKSLNEEISSVKTPQRLRLRLMGIRLASFLHETTEASDHHQLSSDITRYIRRTARSDATAAASGTPSSSSSLTAETTAAVEENSIDDDDDDDEVTIITSHNSAEEEEAEEGLRLASTSAAGVTPSSSSTDVNNSGGTKDMVTLLPETSSGAADAAAEASSFFVCPVCNSQLPVQKESKTTTSCLDQFNSHIDQCLNRTAISELVRRQNQELSDSDELSILHVSSPSSTLRSKRGEKRKRKSVGGSGSSDGSSNGNKKIEDYFHRI